MERERLLAEGEGLVRALAIQIRRTLPDHLELDDLMADGRTGLLEAADRYDPRAGASFTTFAYYRVRGAIYDGLRRMGWLSRGEWSRVRAAERVDDYLSEVAERDAGRAIVGAAADDPAGDLADLLAGVTTVLVTSLGHEPSAAEPPISQGSHVLAPDVALGRSQERRALHAALATLPERERRMIEMVYFEDRSIKEAGEAFSLSKSWASRLHARAVDLLRSALRVDEPEADVAGSGTSR